MWWNRLAAGVYSNSAGELHLSLPELLVAKGWADTPDNREMLARVATEQFAELGVPVEVEDG